MGGGIGMGDGIDGLKSWAGEWSSSDFPASGAASTSVASSVPGAASAWATDISMGGGIGTGDSIGTGGSIGMGGGIDGLKSWVGEWPSSDFPASGAALMRGID